MHTELRLYNINAERLLLNYIERRLSFALSHLGERVGRLTVRINSTGSGRKDLTCRIIADLHLLGTVMAEATETDAYAAIDRCAGRLARRCDSKLTRPRSERASRHSIRTPKSLLNAA